MADEVSGVQPAQPAPSSNEVQSTIPTSIPLPQQGRDTPQRDVVMSDAPTDQAASPAPASFAPRSAQGSRAASAHPDPGLSIPSEAAPHGDSTRRYLNTRVTGVLLEGMKQLAKDQPDEPLRVLGEYLIQRSKELEGTG